ncbi:uncharacterized protein LOC120689274 [Panicum virgatum]|uniref:uncharacterized protein LOC120689274 n=1 Tax=Panicum virgatum TaxID=38727 RepID=UPI0019D65C8E|nr:uncharacterized protein LOC120689274 [Panicum virgatum]
MVEVIMPEADARSAGGSGNAADRPSEVASTGVVGSSSSTAADSAAYAEKAIAKLPPHLAAEAVDPKRKAKSKDPGWKFGWWPDPTKKDFVKCIFCQKTIPAGIKRFKQHLSGGSADCIKCEHVPELVLREMDAYLKKNARTVVVSMPSDEEGDEESDGEGELEPEPQVAKPSCGTKVKQAKKRIVQSGITSFVVAAPTKPQTQKHSRGVDRTATLRKKHEEAWKEYGCSLMSDGWTDTRQRHLINFLANSPADTFFLGSVDASSQVANATMLADLLQKEIEKVGKEHVVQIITDNGTNFKAAGRILMERIPHLFWTPCAAHCLDLLLEDIGKINEFKTCINNARKVSRFIYKHGRLIDQMREKIGGDLVRPAVTRFATSFLTLASMHRNRNGLRNLFVSDEWHNTKFSNTTEGKQVEHIVLSMPFWKNIEDCLRASQPLLVALRIADGDETPVAPEIMAAMDVAKKHHKGIFEAQSKITC